MIRKPRAGGKRIDCPAVPKLAVPDPDGAALGMSSVPGRRGHRPGVDSAELGHDGSCLPLRYGPQALFRTSSLSAWLSRVGSATRRFSRLFASSRCRRRRSSLTSRPPHGAFQRKNVCSLTPCRRAEVRRPRPPAGPRCLLLDEPLPRNRRGQDWVTLQGAAAGSVGRSSAARSGSGHTSWRQAVPATVPSVHSSRSLLVFWDLDTRRVPNGVEKPSHDRSMWGTSLRWDTASRIRRVFARARTASLTCRLRRAERSTTWLCHS